MTTVLVIHASQMGGTAEIADAVTATLSARGLSCVTLPAEAAPAPEQFDAVVLGSALYMGRWLGGATRYLRSHQRALAHRQVFLFQSGPCGVGSRERTAPVPGRVGRLSRAIGCPMPVTFGGLLDPARAVGVLSSRMAQGPLVGDYRDWSRVAAWADEVADTLSTSPLPGATTVGRGSSRLPWPE